MGAQEKRESSVLGLGAAEGKNDPSAWRPSQGVRDREQDPRDATASQARCDEPAIESASELRKAWRPSELAAERLSSLSPRPPRRKFQMPRGVRPLITLVLAVCLIYMFGKLWFRPEADNLRPALAIFIGALTLLIVAAAVGAVLHRRRKRADDKSTLRL